MSFFSSKSESSEGVVFLGNADESVLQFGDLLDTEVQIWRFELTRGMKILREFSRISLVFQRSSKMRSCKYKLKRK